MANKKFFTNTYNTGSGRFNYLRIDHLEDPLFTSFTFDIDYTSSPLFYTISNNHYGYPEHSGLAKNIESALKDMVGKMSSADIGYDILPLFTANFLDGNKLGFGLQQNIYTDLPLYGATEYIYMVDKRNSGGDQNDVRYDSSNFAESGGDPNAYNSYKLGDTVKEIVNESDKSWADKQLEHANEQKSNCEKIMNDESVIQEHERLKAEMDMYAEQCANVKELVDGETEPLGEDELKKKVSEYKGDEEKVGKYEMALENVRTDLYGFENGQVCDKSNPAPYSKYGEYMNAKNKYENDAYSQAERSLKIAGSGIEELTVMSTAYDQQEAKRSSNGFVPTNVNQPKGDSNDNIIVPQTVLDILGFISGMKMMVEDYPYVIHGITGLDKAYENHYGIKDPYMGSGDNKITLTCWESLDLRVSSMFNRYFNAIYDRQYRRERVPVNLRRFNCSVYVHDVRNFVSKSRSGYINRILELTDMYYSVIEFRFYDCEIVPEETGNIFNDISNEAPSEMKKTNFTFTYGNCVVNFIPNSKVATH